MSRRAEAQTRASALLVLIGASVATSCGGLLGLDDLRFDGRRSSSGAGAASFTDGGEGGVVTLPSGGSSGIEGGSSATGGAVNGGEGGEGAGGGGEAGSGAGGSGAVAGLAGTSGQGGGDGASGGVAGGPVRALTAIPIPEGYEKYCSVREEDGTTNDLAWGETPCEDIVGRRAWRSPRIERAGLFDSVGKSAVIMRCSVGGGLWTWIFTPGVRALESAAQRLDMTLVDAGCVFTAAPLKLPIFTAPFSIDPLPPGFEMSNRGYDFASVPGAGSDAEPPQATLDLTLYSQPAPPAEACLATQAGCSSLVTYRGEDRTASPGQDDNRQTFEWRMSPGAPVLAMATGEVIAKRARPVTGCREPEQNELYVRHVVGPSVSSPYSEHFVVYYAHLDFKAGIEVGSVVDGGETVGYVGTSGCTDGTGTLAVSVLRTSNTANAYRVPLDTTPGVYGANGRLPDDSVARIDPWGWMAPLTKANVDPGAYVWYSRTIPYLGSGGGDRVGGGAFSIALFFPGVAPPRPCDRDIRLWAVQGAAAIQNPYADCSP